MLALPRFLTALVGVPLILLAIYFGMIPYLVLVMGIVLLGQWEFYQMADTGGYVSQKWIGCIGGQLLVLSLFMGGPTIGIRGAASAPAMILSLLILLSFARELVRSDKSLSVLRIAVGLLGVLFVAWPLSHLLLLRDIRILSDPAWHLFGRNMVFLLFSVLWAQDTAAWFVGHWIGKHRMASVVSPKKTWEGAVGGILAAVLAAWIVRESAIRVLPRMEVLAIGLGIGIMGQVSDLLESLIKRCLGMKDSSSLLPGHGGILDRFDGFIFTVPFLYYYLVITGRGGL